MVEKLHKLFVTLADNIREAMLIIDKGACEIAMVVDEKNRLLGTITDGDIRRALLRGASLEDSIEKVMNPRFTSVHEDATRSQVLDLMQALSLVQIPILDKEGRLIGLHLLKEMLGRQEKPNWAVVMAGGRGERLRPLTDFIPKPMVPVAGRPILERILLHLIGQGFRNVFFSVNYMSEKIEDHFKDGSSFGCQIQYLREREPLGTGGALSLLPGKPCEPILVLNGDLLTQFDAAEMLAFHEKGKYQATIGCYNYLHTIPYGVINLEGNRVVSLKEKPSESWTVNAGIYVLEPVLLDRIPKNKLFGLPSLIDGCLCRKESIGAHQIAGDWIDVGRYDELNRAMGRG